MNQFPKYILPLLHGVQHIQATNNVLYFTRQLLVPIAELSSVNYNSNMD